ncbi:MAG: ATP-dependent protease La (EC Type I [uncultured Aureispira sp.]|uniref:Lon protease n=1 Tax=uncultured Aureispira sp. TaxID=1331704 RepID=A0A6S6UAP0_9BACT|nr:MAG: ATP-dependent protease La (EC Type I [uncultured Aureispira sp.]
MLSGSNDDVDFLPLFSVNEQGFDENEQESYPDILPILALKNTVLFPGVIIPITVGRPKSIEAVNQAYNSDKNIAVLTQRDIKVADPMQDDLFKVGVVAKILKVLKMPDGTTTAILQGRQKLELKQLLQSEPFLKGSLEFTAVEPPNVTPAFLAIVSSMRELSEKIIKLSPNIPNDASLMLKNIKSRHFLVNFIGSNLNVDIPVKQSLLEIKNTGEKADEILKHMNHELQVLQLKQKIEVDVHGDMEKQQREYILNQQLKKIQEELGESPTQNDLSDLEEKAKTKQWSVEVQNKFDKELRKLKRMNPAAPEHSILVNYLECLVDLPWNEVTEDVFDLNSAEEILDNDHFGLDKVKDRILEHLAVLKLRQDMKSPILCLVGPPGVGKTSLGRSIAKAIGRKYIRMSLGGVHDESELRGHRKTYIGAMPGRIIQSLKKVESANPVFILDEIDKLGSSYKGDPSSALLEVLDPEQNTSFYDNYLELEYDLSKVLFIATANSLQNIQPALLDRMEIIQVSGYSVEEKLEIAKRHLVSKQLKEHGLTEDDLKLSDKALNKVIADYTRESGVRSLDRELAKVMRNVAKKVVTKTNTNKNLTPKEIGKILGPKKVNLDDIFEEEQEAGVAIGLAWTSVGGDILFIESSLSKGKGKLILTGNLGDVMKESATTALSYLRAHGEGLGITPEAFDETNIHIHVPAGGIPKDGPSAGITMLSALASAFTKRPLRERLAMTGEITLRGKVLPVGGIKEKVLAAKRAGVKEIIMCADNEKDVKEINPNYIKGVKFHYVKKMKDVLHLALS